MSDLRTRKEFPEIDRIKLKRRSSVHSLAEKDVVDHL